MSIQLANFDERVQKAVASFWQTRTQAKTAQGQRALHDQGERASVTAGKHMDGFVDLIHSIVADNGLPDADVQRYKNYVVLPGYFRPTKQWDLLVVHNKMLVGAFELKSQVGSFGNNFNNRCEEVIGSAIDLWTAFREGAFGDSPRPFVGYVMLLEDAPEVHTAVKNDEPHFNVFSEFKNSSYASRYELLCERLVAERLYDATALILSSRVSGTSGAYIEPSPRNNLRMMMADFAGRIAAIASLNTEDS